VCVLCDTGIFSWHFCAVVHRSPAKLRMHVYWPHIRYDTSIRMWNTTTGKCEAIFGGEHKSTIICIDANYDAGIMLAGSSDKHMSLWRLPNRGYRKPSRGPAVNQTSTKAQLHYGMEGQGSSTKPMLINSFLHDGEVRAVCIFRDSLSGVCTAVSGTDTGASSSAPRSRSQLRRCYAPVPAAATL
jgi:WD40 repeat protein